MESLVFPGIFLFPSFCAIIKDKFLEKRGQDWEPSGLKKLGAKLAPKSMKAKEAFDGIKTWTSSRLEKGRL